MRKFCYLFFFLTACTPSGHLLNQKDNYKQGSYRGSYYIVQKGDTLHYIAYITDRNIENIALANNLVNVNKIYPGQKLNLWREKYIPPSYGKKQAQKKLVKGRASSYSITSVDENKTFLAKSKQNPKKEVKHNNAFEYSKADTYTGKLTKSSDCVKFSAKNNDLCSDALIWQWPTKGQIISDYSSADYGNKGIDISGRRGQSIVASANGKVVYAGNALRGYGNLIIIKHNENYLSAYAHNESLLVKESQNVKKGQEIATMGSTGSDVVGLHFEIRYKGKSVDPNRFLPEV